MRGGQAVGSGDRGADRNMWQRLGGYPKAIVERNPSGARESQRGNAGGSIFETRKKGRREKRIPTPSSRTLSLPLSLFLFLSFSLSLLSLFLSPHVPRCPSRRLQGWRPNRWANFFAAQFNEASLNSLPGAADRSRGTDGGRARGVVLEGMRG